MFKLFKSSTLAMLADLSLDTTSLEASSEMPLEASALRTNLFLY